MATTTAKTFDDEQYASKLDEIGNKLPNLVGDHLALVAYGAELKGLAQRVRNPEDVKANPAGQPDVRPSIKDLHGDGQDEAMRPKYRLAQDENAPQHLPIAETNAATAAVYAMNEKRADIAPPPLTAADHPFGEVTGLMRGTPPDPRSPEERPSPRYTVPSFRAGVAHPAETYTAAPPTESVRLGKDYYAQVPATNTEQSVTDNTKYGTGSDTQKSPGNPGKL